MKQYPVRQRAAVCARATPRDADAPNVSCAQWQAPVLMKLEKPIDTAGNPWPLDEAGKPILNA